MRPFWLPDDLLDRGPLATVPQRPEARHAAEPPRKTVIFHEEREKRWENERRAQERSRLLVERRNARRVIPSDVPYHLSGQRAPEASGVDFAGTWSPSSLWFPLLRRRPTSCCSLFEKNIFAIVFMIQTCRIQNPDTPRAGRVGAAHGGAAGRGGAG